MKVSLLNLFGPLRLEADLVPPRLTVTLVGEFDFAGHQAMTVCDNLDLEQVTLIVVDLRRLDFLDSSACRALNRFVVHHSSRGRRVELVHARPHVLRVMGLVGGVADLSASDSQLG